MISQKLSLFSKESFLILLIVTPLFLLIIVPSSHANIDDELVSIENNYNLGQFSPKQFQAALDTVNVALQRPDLTDEDRAELLEWKGRCLVRLGAEMQDQAKLSFLALLEIDENWTLESDSTLEKVVFQDALRQYQNTRGGQVGKKQPSNLNAIISTSITAASGVTYLVLDNKADDQWADYESTPGNPDDLYDQYKSTANSRNIAGYIAIGTGVISGVLWIKYLVDKKNFDNASLSLGPLELQPVSQGLTVSLRF